MLLQPLLHREDTEEEVKAKKAKHPDHTGSIVVTVVAKGPAGGRQNRK
jgi:hypothetical protein